MSSDIKISGKKSKKCYYMPCIGRSSNGRTEAFEAFNWGSIPCLPAKKSVTIFNVETAESGGLCVGNRRPVIAFVSD
jgi:hypothetical protein